MGVGDKDLSQQIVAIRLPPWLFDQPNMLRLSDGCAQSVRSTKFLYKRWIMYKGMLLRETKPFGMNSTGLEDDVIFVKACKGVL